MSSKSSGCGARTNGNPPTGSLWIPTESSRSLNRPAPSSKVISSLRPAFTPISTSSAQRFSNIRSTVSCCVGSSHNTSGTHRSTWSIAPAMGGIVVAQEVGRQLHKRTMFTERKDGEMLLRRGFEIKRGERVLVCEDVVTTGGSVLEVINIVGRNGGVVAGVGYIVDRSGGRVQFPIGPGGKQRSVLTMDVVSSTPESCPLCRAGVPVVKPGSRGNDGPVGKLAYHTVIGAGILLVFLLLIRVVRWILNLVGRRVISKTESIPDDRLLVVALKSVGPVMIVTRAVGGAPRDGQRNRPGRPDRARTARIRQRRCLRRRGVSSF